MHPADPDLANWVGLYDQLVTARARLKEAPGSPDLQDEIRRLTRLAGVVLDRISRQPVVFGVPEVGKLDNGAPINRPGRC